MPKFTFTKGATSVIIPVSVFDSSSVIGAKLTGLVYNTSGLVAYYDRVGVTGAAVQISLVTATKGTWTSSGFIAVDANMTGDYQLHLPDAVCAAAAGVNIVMIQLRGAANMVPVDITIELTAVDLQDGMRGGMTALPNAAAGASGGVPLSVDASGRVDLLKVNGTSQTARDLGANLDVAVSTRAPESSGNIAAIKAQTDALNNIEASMTLSAVLRIILAAVAGKTTNGQTKFRDAADTKNRISAVITGGDRTSITLDGS